MQRIKIFVAAIPSVAASFVRWLNPNYDLLVVTSMEQARRLLDHERGITLFLIGAHFDDSRSMNLINEIRAKEAFESTPIIVVRTIRSEYADVLKQTFTLMKSLNRITDYFDFDSQEDAGPTVVEAVNQALNIGDGT